MIHHVSLGTNDVARARAFYDPIMALLGLRPMAGHGRSVDYGVGDIQFSLETPTDGRPASAGNGHQHVIAAGSNQRREEGAGEACLAGR